MGGACSSFTTSSSPTIYSTSVTDSKAMQVESCSSAVGVSNRGVSDKQLTSNTVQQQQSTPKRHTVLYISPPPEDLLDNSRMSCQDEGCGLESEQSCSMWMEDSPSNFSNMSTSSYNDNTEVPRKSRKRNPKQRPGIKRRDCEESNMDIFDADSAKAPHYVLSQLSTDSKGNSKAGNGASENQKGAGGKKTPMLCGQYPTKSEGKELKIVVQPETQHRARYLTEGSRGSVKDRTQQGFPTVKGCDLTGITETRGSLHKWNAVVDVPSCLERREEIVYHTEQFDCTDLQHETGGWPAEIRGGGKLRDNVLVSVTDCLTEKLEGHNEPVMLQVFVGNDSGRVKPHGFYQACRVTGRNTTPCKEVDIEGTTVIEVGLDPSNNMTLAVDCVGILKLRNADVEARIGIAGSKKKSTRARLVFRVNITRKDGSTLTLQTPSSPILCTQPAGVPEILKKSLHSCSVKGEEEVFLIGKNFLKGTKVIFQENVSDENSWKAEAEIDMELFHQNHLIVKVPPYHDQQITSAVSVGIYVVTNAGRSHDVQPFTYTPDTSGTLNVNVKKEISSPAHHCSFEEAIKAVKATGCNLEKVNILPSALITPLMPSSMIKNEDVAPMEVSAEKRSPPVFKASNVVGPTQQTLENSMSGISTSASHLPSENENQQQIQPKVYNAETLTTIQTQDISQPDTAVHSRPENLLPGRAENVHSQPENALSNQQQQQQQQQQQAMETSAAMSPVYQQASHIMSGLSTSEDMQMQCEIFSSSPGVSGNGEEASGQSKQMQSTVFQTMASGTQQQGGALFQQGGEIMSIQSGSFMQQSPHSQAQLFHSQNPIDQLQPPMFHSQNTMDCGQLLTSGPASLPEELMAISQPGQPQSEGQAAVPTLLSQQISETPPLPSAMATNQNIEKIDDLLVSLQNQGNNMAGSF
ncbi:nuclear factor of activated t-cells 5 [Limosa lapponica baueri]|uniref:Nuclear factor of activated T-cells 5 n=1 Tax=Limosa lapponica baueri TaxID=1758121 RepID=A0A2I0TRW0_LIMLA|nr:nuclear factor of activated t-cells 5 [Limosa lapponica baueri]